MSTPWIPIGLIGLFVVAIILGVRQKKQFLNSGLLPPPGQATPADVERLLKAGHKIEAIRCYREIHKCGLAEAKQAVDEMQSRLQP